MKPIISFAFLLLLQIYAPYSLPILAAELTREQVIALGNDKRHKLNLKKKDLSGLDLFGIDFSGADLFSANLDGCKLDGAKVRKVKGRETVLGLSDMATQS